MGKDGKMCELFFGANRFARKKRDNDVYTMMCIKPDNGN